MGITLYNTAIKISVCDHTHISLISYLYTQNSKFILNAPLECIKFELVHIGNVLLQSIHLDL